MRVVHARRRSTCAVVADDRGRRRVASLWREAVSSSVALANNGILGATKTSASSVAGGSASRRAYAKATKKETMTKNKKTTTTTKTTTTAKKTTRKKKDESSSSTKLGKSVSSKGGAIRTDAPPKVEKVHVLPHLPVVRTIGNTPPSSPSFAATAATATSSNSSTTTAAHRTDAPPRVEKVTVLPHLPARADGGRIAPSSVTTRATVAGVGAASGKGASSSSSSSSTSSSFEQKQQQNVNAEGLDFGTVARALAGMAIVVGGIYSVVSSPSSGHQNAKKKMKMKMKSINDEAKKSREELNDKEHHEPLLIEETAESKVAVESKEDESVSAQKVKPKNEEDEERMAEDLLIQKLREDAAKLIEEEFTRAFVPDSSTSSTSTSPQPETTTTTTQSSSSSPSLSSEDVSRPKYGEKEVAKELTEVFETASKLLTKVRIRILFFFS